MPTELGLLASLEMLSVCLFVVEHGSQTAKSSIFPEHCSSIAWQARSPQSWGSWRNLICCKNLICGTENNTTEQRLFLSQCSSVEPSRGHDPYPLGPHDVCELAVRIKPLPSLDLFLVFIFIYWFYLFDLPLASSGSSQTANYQDQSPLKLDSWLLWHTGLHSFLISIITEWKKNIQNMRCLSYLQQNQFTGTIPTEMGKLKLLEAL